MAQPSLGVCSWSLQVSNIPDLVRLSAEVGAEVVQVGIGDTTHGAWDEGADFVGALQASGLELSGTMIGFPGEDYTSPATIRETGGFGDPALRAGRLEIFRYAVDKTAELGLQCLCSHAGFIPEEDGPERSSFLDCIAEAAQYAGDKDVLFTMETGQETAALLRRIGEKALAILLDRDLDAVPPALAQGPIGATCKVSLPAPRHLLFRYRPAQTSIVEILDAVAVEGLTIVDLTTEETDLEDIFLQITHRPPDNESDSGADGEAEAGEDTGEDAGGGGDVPLVAP